MQIISNLKEGENILTAKKILIPGGKVDDLFLVDAAHKLGLYVITSGTDESAPAHSSAEKYICADYSDMEAMLKIAEDEHINYMCSCANDFGYISTTYVCEKLGLPGHDSYKTALTIHNKDKFKKFAREIGLSVPGGDSFQDSASALEYLKAHFESSTQKLIMKPIDSCAGRGILEVERFSKCEEAVKNAFENSRLGRIVIEPYIKGQLHSASVFFVNQKVVFCFIEEGFVNPENMYGVMCAVSPAKDKEKIKRQVISEFEKVSFALNLVDGKMHANFIVDDSGKVWIVEMHRRSSGDTYTKFIEFSTGIKWNEQIVKSECGLNVKDFPMNAEQKGFNMILVFMAKSNGIYQGVYINDYLKSVTRCNYFHFREGMQIKDYRLNRIGVAHLNFNSYEEMRTVAENPDNYFKVIVKEI